MFELPLSSEIAGFINFLTLELIVMSYIMFATSVIAGSLNYRAIQKGTTLSLKVFDVPHIGGGLVMNASRARWLLIFIRFSALVAITVSNFGLEGRTRPIVKFQEALVRRPGVLEPLNTATLFNATERRMRCAKTDGDKLVFGAVLDGFCYPSLNTDVHVQSISLNFTQFNASALGCTVVPEEELFFTVYRCRDMDLNCLGLFYGGEEVEKGRCESVIYEENVSWLCPVHSARPGVVDEPVECRLIRARRTDIARWPDIFRYRTDDLETAVFGAAYGVEERKLVAVPTGEENVTIVSMFWLVPAIYEICIVWIVTIWGIFLMVRGAKNVGNDERGLTRLLRRRLDMTIVQLGEWLDTDNDEPVQTLHRSQPDEVAYP